MSALTHHHGRSPYIVCFLTHSVFQPDSNTDRMYRKTCGHSFSSEAIRQYLGNSLTNRKKCPTTGCNKVISLDDFRADRELAKKAREAARRERMREEEEGSGGEEIID